MLSNDSSDTVCQIQTKRKYFSKFWVEFMLHGSSRRLNEKDYCSILKCAMLKWSPFNRGCGKHGKDKERMKSCTLKCNRMWHRCWVQGVRVMKTWGTLCRMSDLGINNVWQRGDVWCSSVRMDEGWESACVTSLPFPRIPCVGLFRLSPLSPFALLRQRYFFAADTVLCACAAQREA